jgi:hypothetical protein
MSTRAAASLSLLLVVLSSNVRAATLDRDWARIYNPPGTENVLGMWPAPGGGVDIAVDNAGQLVYIQYNSAGTLTAQRATGVPLTTGFSILVPDGIGGFLRASLEDSGFVVLRVSASGTEVWHTFKNQILMYPQVMKIANGKIYVGVDYDYGTSYDPLLLILNLESGAQVCEDYQVAYFFRISDLEVMEDGSTFLVGYDNSGCDCSTWFRIYDADCNLLRTNSSPGHSFAQFEPAIRNVLLTTSAVSVPLSRSSFGITWLQNILAVPDQYVDSRDFMQGGCRADILVKKPAGFLVGGEHDAGGGAQELILGTGDEFSSLDVDLFRPDGTKSYDALQVVSAGMNILMQAKQSNLGGSFPARVVLLFNENRVLLDYDVEGNITSPKTMVVGQDGGVYTVGSGPASGVVLTKLLISGAIAVDDGPDKAPHVSRLGMPSPNPATSSIRLDYEVAGNVATTMEIYDPSGRLVTKLVEGTPRPGPHVAEWDTHNVAKGVYFVRFKSGTSYATRKIVID